MSMNNEVMNNEVIEEIVDCNEQETVEVDGTVVEQEDGVTKAAMAAVGAGVVGGGILIWEGGKFVVRKIGDGVAKTKGFLGAAVRKHRTRKATKYIEALKEIEKYKKEFPNEFTEEMTHAEAMEVTTTDNEVVDEKK